MTPSSLHISEHSLHDPGQDLARRLPVLAGGTIAALFVERGGVYFGQDGVDPWGVERDARAYAGPFPVIAHPPCDRWGRFWHGAPNKPHQYRLGDDGGCFEAALSAVRRFGGVLEHPAHSHAWAHFGLNRPARTGGWSPADFEHGWTCHVEQGNYGHFARKATWLYACRGPALQIELPDLRWGAGPQRIHPIALARHGYEKARRIGVMAMVGGKYKSQIRAATPIEFRDLLLSIARSVYPSTDHIRPSRAGPVSACQGLNGRGLSIGHVVGPCDGLATPSPEVERRAGSARR